MNRLLIWTTLMVWGITFSQSQEPETIRLSEIAVSATRTAKETFRTPNSISVIERQQIDRMSPTIMPQILSEVGGVFAQQTTVGQGSPVLRGLTGYQTSINIDGVRLNNSTFRSGPNQYLSTIAPHNLDRIKVLRGPGSMLYGSGAMGGVISVFTDKLRFSDSGKIDLTPQARVRFSTAQSGRVGQLGLKGGNNQLAFSLNASARRFGDLKLGKGYNLHYPNRKFEIVDQQPGLVFEDRWLVEDESPLGWSAVDATAKAGYQINPDQQVSLAYQAWRQPETNRYDKISTGEYELYQFAPQNRNLLYANYVLRRPLSFVDEANLTASYHRQYEGRREIKAKATQQKERFDLVHTYGLGGQIVSTALSHQRIIIGGEFYFDSLSSKTVKTELSTNQKMENLDWGRFPNGSTALDFNLFAQNEVEVRTNLQLIFGGRFTHYALEADLSSRDQSFGLYQKSGQALTGSAGLVFGITDNLNWVTNFGTAFRAPNLNDTTVVEVTNEGIDAPSLDVTPERGWTAEIGLKANFSRIIGSVTLYHSQISDLISRVPVQAVYRNDWPQLYRNIQQENPETEIFIQENIDRTQIRGLEFSGTMQLAANFTMYGHWTVTRGRVLQVKGSAPDTSNPWSERIRREPPPMGMVNWRWQDGRQRFWSEFYIHGAMQQRRLSQGDIRDPRIQGKTRDPKSVQFDLNGLAIDAGTPDWYTLNLRSGVKLGQFVDLNASIENLLNRRYRQHGSGISAPGLNLTTSLSTLF